MDYFKIMVLPHDEDILWDMKTGDQLPMSHKAYSYIQESSHFNVSAWVHAYSDLYIDWLKNDNLAIYDIDSVINKEILDFITKIQPNLPFKLYFWFDVNRDLKEGYLWTVCPISKQPLLELNDDFSLLNKLVSPIYPITFPVDG